MSKPPLSLLERIALERFLPKPIRVRDAIDELAFRKHHCPVCISRQGCPCFWAELAAVRSWCTHSARRALVDDVDYASINIIGRRR